MLDVPEPTLVDVGDTRLAVRSWGPEDGRPVLYVHHLGVTGGSLHAHETASGLAARGYRVTAADEPGFGQSPALPPERYLLDGLAALQVGLLDRLGIQRVAVIGLSWGASVAVHLAAAAPERVAALALLDAGHVDPDGSQAPQGFEQQVAEAQGVIRDHYTFGSVEEALDAQKAQSARWSPLIERSWRAAFDQRGGVVRPALAAETFAAAAQGFRQRPPSNAWPALGAAGLPVLLLLAGQPPERLADQRADSARFAAAVPQALLRWMQGNGHNLVVELGEALGDELATWLESAGWR